MAHPPPGPGPPPPPTGELSPPNGGGVQGEWLPHDREVGRGLDQRIIDRLAQGSPGGPHVPVLRSRLSEPVRRRELACLGDVHLERCLGERGALFLSPIARRAEWADVPASRGPETEGRPLDRLASLFPQRRGDPHVLAPRDPPVLHLAVEGDTEAVRGHSLERPDLPVEEA